MSVLVGRHLSIGHDENEPAASVRTGLQSFCGVINRIKECPAGHNSFGTHGRNRFRRGLSDRARRARTGIVDDASVTTEIDQTEDRLKDHWSRRRGIAGRNMGRLFRRDGFHDIETLLDFFVIAGEVGELKDQLIVVEGGHFIEFAEAVSDCYE